MLQQRFPHKVISSTNLPKSRGGIYYEIAPDMMFPLGQCLFEGGYFPCPRFPEMFLTSFYGPGWKVPQASRKQKGTDLFFFTQPLKLLANLWGSGSFVAPPFRRLEGSWRAHDGGNVSHSTHLRRRRMRECGAGYTYPISIYTNKAQWIPAAD